MPSPADSAVFAQPLGHLPLVRSLIDQLGISEVLDELLPMDPRSKVSESDCVTTMILNILGGRVALYRMEQWTAKLPVDVLIGDHCAPEDFNDNRLAMTLDRLFSAGTDTILSQVVNVYLQRPDRVTTYSIHQDTTSASVYGAYEGEAPEWAPHLTWGFSKDHRPDLKQLVFGLSLHGAVGLPLVATMFDGNTSDKFANDFHIESLAACLPKEDEVTLVADSKLVNATTIGALVQQKFHFISLIPRTYALRSTLVDRLCDEDHPAPGLARTKGRNRATADTVYTGRSYEADFKLHKPGEEEEEQMKLRFLVVHSSSRDAQFERQLPDKLAKELQRLKSALEKANKNLFSCLEDAQSAAQRLSKTLKLHQVTLGVETVTVIGKRPPGRPKKGSSTPQETCYRLILDAALPDLKAIEATRRSKTHFVLITDHLDAENWSDRAIFAEYRKQHMIEGNTGFRWLKGPAQVAPIFLKRPERIAGLGLVLVLALIVRNFLQFSLRTKLAENQETIPYYDRKRVTSKPTAEVVWELFSDIVLITVSSADDHNYLQIQGMDDDKRRVLDYLGLTEDVFLGRRLNKVLDST